MNKDLKIGRRELLQIGAATAAVAALPATVAAQPKPIKLGYVAPLSGRLASYGVSASPGIAFMAKQINAAGGIKSLGGAKLEILNVDTKGDTKVTISEIERLINDEEVAGVIGPFSSLDAIAANPLADQYKIPFISPFWTSEKAFALNTRYARTLNITSDTYSNSSVHMLKHLQDKHGLAGKRVGLVYDNSEFGRTIAIGVKTRLEKVGVTPVIDLPITPPVTDLSPSILRLRDSGADVILGVLYFNEVVLYFRAADTLGYKVPVIGCASGYTDTRLPDALGPEVAKRALVNVPVIGATTGLRRGNKYAPLATFFDSLKNEAIQPGVTPGVELDWYTLGAQSVVAFQLAFEQAASTDGTKVNDAILKMNVARGSSSLILPFYDPGLAWETNGQPKNQAASFAQWRDNKPVIVYPDDVASAPLKL
jgi:branched-chain amino acid transport system substrate-binding protein